MKRMILIAALTTSLVGCGAGDVVGTNYDITAIDPTLGGPVIVTSNTANCTQTTPSNYECSANQGNNANNLTLTIQANISPAAYLAMPASGSLPSGIAYGTNALQCPQSASSTAKCIISISATQNKMASNTASVFIPITGSNGTLPFITVSFTKAQ